MKGNKKRDLGGLPNKRHEFTRVETCEDCNCEAIERALGEWQAWPGDDYNGHHGDCVATNHDLIPPRRKVEHVVTLGLHCARCNEPAKYIQFWEQRYGRHNKCGAIPLCGEHMISEAAGMTDKMQVLYRPGEDELFDVWMEVTLYLLQKLFVSCLEP